MSSIENNHLTLTDFLKKIVKYWYILLLLILATSLSTFTWEKNKKIYNVGQLTISPLSILEYEKIFSTTNFSKITDNIINIQSSSNVDSFYILNYTPLSLLYAYSIEIKKILFNDEFKDEKLKEFSKNLNVTLSTADSQINIFLWIKSTKNEKEIKEFFDWFTSEANLKLKKNLINLVEKELNETKKKINLLNEINAEKNIEIITNYKIKTLELEDILIQSNNKFVSYEVENIGFKNNKTNMLTLMTLSIFFGIFLGLTIIIIIPNKD